MIGSRAARLLCAAVLFGTPQLVQAQYAPAEAFRTPQRAVEGTALGEPRERKELPPGFVGKQVLAGVGGTAVGGLLGGFVGAMTTDGNGGLEELGPFLMGMIVGGMVGSAVTVQWYSRRAGFESPFWATAAGTVVGLAGGPLFVFTVPIGSTIGFNLARK